MIRSARLATLTLLLSALCVAFPVVAGAQPGPLTFGACSPKQVFVSAPGLQCATLHVPFDRADPSVGNIALAVQRVPASTTHVGTIVLLAGGPGQPALPVFESFLAPLAREASLRGFELVAFDQRGTGQSEGLQCPESEAPMARTLTAYLGECGTALGPTRAFYTSQESVEDIDALREALGGTPLSLFAVSYGGRVAGMYAREHPDGVARMVLDSPSPLTGADALETARVHALKRVLDEGICGAGACRSFSSDVFADLTHVVAGLRLHPLRTKIYDARGRLQEVSVTEASVFRLLSSLDLAKGPRELTPAALAAAAHGYAAPLARLAASAAAGSPASKAQAPGSEAAISVTLFAATYCDESELPWSADSAPAGRSATLRNWLAAQPAEAFSPFAASTIANTVRKVCLDWPATSPAPSSPTGTSAVPTLLLSGADDLRTPYEQTLRLSQAYSHGQLLGIPDTGHSTVTTDETGCAKAAMLEFITTGQAPASCAGSSEPQALPLPPAALAQVPAGASGPPVAGRVATAAAMTIEDLLGQTSFAGGGLRGGSWAEQLSGYVLHGMVDVPGVALSGKIHVGSTAAGLPVLSGRLTVRGRLPGTLTLHNRLLGGRVGGAHVHATLEAL